MRYGELRFHILKLTALLSFLLLLNFIFVTDVQAYDAGWSIQIPTQGIEASIVPLQLRSFGNNRITWDTSNLRMQVGHLTGTAWFGEPNNTVLAGHSLLGPGQPDIFINLGSVRTGDSIVVRGDGTEHTYTVTQVYTVAYTDLSPAYPTGFERLTLITCDTETFDGARYTGRVVVVAERATAPTPVVPAAPVETVFTPVQSGITLTPTVNLNVRTGAGTHYARIGRITPGSYYTVLGEQDGWMVINYNGQQAFVSGDYIRLTSEAPTPQIVLTPGSPIYHLDYTIRLRNAPTTESATLLRIPHGTSLNISARSADSRWLWVNYGATTGWVAGWFGAIEGNLQALPIRE